MKYLNAFAFVAALGSVVACDGGSGDVDGGAGAGTGGTGTATGGTGTATGGTGTATGGAGTGGTGTGGGGNPDAIIATCPDQTYTPAADDGDCPSSAAPAIPQIQDFETDSAGWGVYPNDTEGSTTVPDTSFPAGGGAVVTSAGGPADSTKAIRYAGTGFGRGIRIEAGFRDADSEIVCQDVKAFEGLSFWAKGSISAETADGWDALANELVIQLPTAAGDYPDKRVTLTADWVQYQIPFDCFGTGTTFGGYFESILFVARGETFDVSIDQVEYY